MLQTEEEHDAKERFWVDITRLGKSIERQLDPDGEEDLSAIAPHLLGRR